MKKIKFLILFALLGTFAAQAQQPNRPNFDPKERAARTVDELSKQITITPAVQDSLKVVFVKFFDDMRKERESGNRPDMAAMEIKRDAKVKTFLTDDQFKAYQKFMEERKNRRNRPGGQGGQGGMPEHS